MAMKDFPKFTRASAGNLFLLDCMDFDYATVQLSGTWAGTISWEASNDPSAATWSAVPSVSAASVGSSTAATSNSANAVLIVPTRARFLRARISTYTSGTFAADVVLATGDAPELGVPVWIQNNFVVPTAQGGNTTFVKSAAAAILANLKTSAGNIFGIYLRNNSAADKYIRFYNKASAPVVADTPVCVFRIPAGQDLRFDHELAFPRFSTGISYGISGGAPDNDATALAVNDVSGFILWA